MHIKTSLDFCGEKVYLFQNQHFINIEVSLFPQDSLEFLISLPILRIKQKYPELKIGSNKNPFQLGEILYVIIRYYMRNIEEYDRSILGHVVIFARVLFRA